MNLTYPQAEILTRALPIVDIPSAFQGFKLEEQQAWADSNSQPETGSTLVRPSGCLNASFATSNPPCEEVADRANPCIHMVMENGWHEHDTLLFDHLHRRSRKSEGFQTFPENVGNIHEDFTRQLQDSSAAKVEVAYSSTVRTLILRNSNLTNILLWRPFNDVFLSLLHEDSFQHPN